jgi:hypothetical protein
MGWGFVWLMLVLKIPIGMLLGLVWWAVRETDEPEDAPRDDGGSKVDPADGRDRPRRRGPHGDPPPASPPRVRRAHPVRHRVER